MFRNREDAGLQLAEKLTGRHLREPLVIAIPRGGVVVGKVLAEKLNAEFDVLLSHKLRAPNEPKLALGAISESGEIHLNVAEEDLSEQVKDYLVEERRHQVNEIDRRKLLYREARPAAAMTGRSVIVTDDGIATGASMIAVLKTVWAQKPYEIIMARPVTSPDCLNELRRWCDEVVSLIVTDRPNDISKYYEQFNPVEDEQAMEILRASYSMAPTSA